MISTRRMLMIGSVISLLCIALCAVFWDGFYLPYKPCRPLVYASGQSSNQARTTIITSDAFDQVINFYNQHLNPQPAAGFATGVWRQLDTQATFVSYACSSSDINMLTAETGCIFIIKEADKTSIVTELLTSEGSSVPCQGP